MSIKFDDFIAERSSVDFWIEFLSFIIIQWSTQNLSLDKKSDHNKKMISEKGSMLNADY